MIIPFRPLPLTIANTKNVLVQLIDYVMRWANYQEPVTLTDAATITLDASKAYNAKVTLGANRTLAFSNLTAGDYITLQVIQGGAGSFTLTLPACKVSGGGAGAVTLSTAAGSIDVLTFYYDGITLFCNLSTDFT